MYEQSRLNNGLNVVTGTMPGRESVSVGLWIGVGGRHEPRRHAGISHFLEHLLFKGTQRHSCEALKQAIEGVGGNFNAFTAEEFTCYFVKVPAQHLKRSIRILSEMVTMPLLAESDIERERGVILEEIRMYQDHPNHLVSDRLQQIMWPDHPLGVLLAGDNASVRRITPPVLRSYCKRFYGPPNITLVACGALEHRHVMELADQAFAKSQRVKRPTSPTVRVAQRHPRCEIIEKPTEQSQLALGFYGFRRTHPAQAALSVMNTILGGNMSSRLFREVRERRGLAYEIYSSLKRYADTGAVTIGAGVDKAQVPKALRVIFRELEKIQQRPPAASELRRAKDYFSGQLRLALEDTLDHMLWIGERSVAGLGLVTADELQKRVESVTAKSVQRVAGQVFRPGRRNVVVLGPKSGVDVDGIQAVVRRS